VNKRDLKNERPFESRSSALKQTTTIKTRKIFSFCSGRLFLTGKPLRAGRRTDSGRGRGGRAVAVVVRSLGVSVQDHERGVPHRVGGDDGHRGNAQGGGPLIGGRRQPVHETVGRREPHDRGRGQRAGHGRQTGEQIHRAGTHARYGHDGRPERGRWRHGHVQRKLEIQHSPSQSARPGMAGSSEQFHSGNGQSRSRRTDHPGKMK